MPSVATRLPLEDTTNSSPTSPTYTIRSVTPTLRHKRSKRHLHEHLDSSESFPSPHSSVYDASVIQRGSSNASPEPDPPLPSSIKAFPPQPHWTSEDISEPQPWEQTVHDDDGNLVPASFLQPVTPLHTPHKLDPIKEQVSLMTIASHRSVSTDPSHRHDAHSPTRTTTHKRSFSTSDIPASSQNPLIPDPPIELSPVNYPLPARPVKLPPVRIPTPPNLPSFGSKEAANYRLPPPKPTRLRDRLNPHPTPEEMEWRRQTVGLPRGVVMRGDDGTLVSGKFRPVRSGHMPPDVVKGAVEQREPRPIGRVPGLRGDSLDMERAAAWNRRGVVRSASQVERSRRIRAETEERERRERLGRKERKMKVLKKIVWVCCPVDGWMDEEEGAEMRSEQRRREELGVRGGERGGEEFGLAAGVEAVR